jgi:hypothetical protein
LPNGQGAIVGAAATRIVVHQDNKPFHYPSTHCLHFPGGANSAPIGPQTRTWALQKAGFIFDNRLVH